MSNLQKTKKIVLVSDLNFRYQTHHPLDLAEVLADRGFDISIIAPVPKDISQLQSSRGFKIIRQPAFKGRLGYAFGMLDAIYKVIRIRPDIIIGVNQGGYIPAYMASRLLKHSHLIYWAMELSRISEGNRGLITRFQERFARKADMVWSTNIERARVMQADWNLDEEPYVLPNSLVTPRACESNGRLRNLSQNYQPGDYIVLYATGLAATTAVPQLIESVIYWNKGIKLVIIGFGDRSFLDKMIIQIKELNLGDRIEFLGSFPKSEVYQLLPDADLGLVLWNHRNALDLNTILCSPGKLLEYAAHGVPVICSDNPSLTYVEKEGWGLCVDPDDPISIAAGVNRFFRDNELLVKMKILCRQRFVEEYCMEVQGQRLLREMQSRGII